MGVWYLKSMQCKSTSLLPGCAAALAALALLLAGCELESADRRIEISPNSATLKYGESVTLNALYGYIYAWSLSSTTLGTLNTRSGQQVIYTSMSDPASAEVQTITVTSTFSDNDTNNSSGSNAPVVHTAEAYITHINSSNSP